MQSRIPVPIESHNLNTYNLYLTGVDMKMCLDIKTTTITTKLIVFNLLSIYLLTKTQHNKLSVLIFWVS